jgi:hypothetical protein
MKMQSSLVSLLVVCLMVASAFVGITGDYIGTNDSNGPFQAESGLVPGTEESPASPESEGEGLAADGIVPAASRTPPTTLGTSFPEDWTCPVENVAICHEAKLTGAAHNGYLNYFIEVGAGIYPDSAYSEPTAVESMQGFEEVLALLTSGVLENPDFGCFVSNDDGNVDWIVPCPYGTYTEEGTLSADDDMGRERDPPFKYRKLESEPLPPLPILPEDPCVHMAGTSPPPGCPQDPPGSGPGGPIQQDSCRLDNSFGEGFVLYQPCPVPFYSFATGYADLRSDLLVKAEDLYKNNDLGNMSEWERDRTVALHPVNYYSEGGNAVLSDEQRNLVNEVFGLLEDYFKIAGDATEDGENITLEDLDQAIDAVFSDSAFESAKPDAQRVVALVHSTHYASKAFWTDYDSSSRWNWERFWEIVGDTAAIVGGAAISVYGGDMGTIVGGAIVLGATSSYKNSVGGGGGDPPVECPLDRSLDQNWWSCAIFSQTVRPLRENEAGNGTEWAPDAIIPYFARDWRGDHVSVAVYASNEGSAAAQLWDQETTEYTRILVLHPEGEAGLAAWNCTPTGLPDWLNNKPTENYDCVELDPPSAHENTRSIGLLIDWENMTKSNGDWISCQCQYDDDPIEGTTGYYKRTCLTVDYPDCDSCCGINGNCVDVSALDDYEDCDGIDEDCSGPYPSDPDVEEDPYSSIPGFTMPLAFSAMLAAAILIRRKRLV